MKFRFTIGRKLSLGFGILVLAILVNGVLTYVTLKSGKQLNEKVSKTYTPSIDKLKDLDLMILQSKDLTTDWLDNQEQDTPEKIHLEKIHDYEYPEIRNELRTLMVNWEYSDQLHMDSVFSQIDSLLEIQHDIMISFATESDYNNLDEVFRYVASIEYGDIDKFISNIANNIKALTTTQTNYAEAYSIEMINAFDRLQNYVTLLGSILVLGGLLIGYFTIRSIVKPLDELKEILSIMGKGVLPEAEFQHRSDEIGEMSSALSNLVDSLQRTSQFSKEIGEGNFNSSFSPLSEQDTLGTSLLIMRDNLALVADDDKKRNWTTGGLAKFGEILRKNSDNVSNLSQALISELIKYLDANQGGIFIVNNENKEEESYLDLVGCYAWDRLKFLEEKVYIGEGLVGQVWQERCTLYITDIPDDYIKITSGLGDATPSCLLLVPMMVNDEFFGVIEIASFVEYEDYQIKFVEQVAETTASTISSVKVNQKTKELLGQTQNATKQMSEKEEHMRQEQELMTQKHKELKEQLEFSQNQSDIFEKKNLQLEEENEILQTLLLKASKKIDSFKKENND